jgi:IS5 family transposase
MVVRLDSTVTAALLHKPSDSSLLWDGVRVMVRLLKAADALVRDLVWRNHRRAGCPASMRCQLSTKGV